MKRHNRFPLNKPQGTFNYLGNRLNVSLMPLCDLLEQTRPAERRLAISTDDTYYNSDILNARHRSASLEHMVLWDSMPVVIISPGLKLKYVIICVRKKYESIFV